MTPPFRAGLAKGNNSISASIPTLPGWAFKGGGKGLTPYSERYPLTNQNHRRKLAAM